MATLGSLVISLQADVGRLQTDMAKAVGIIDRTTSTMRNSVKSAMAGLATGIGVGAFAGLIKSSINAADELGKMAQKSGVTVEALSSLKYAADLSDVSFDTLGGALTKLGNTMSKAAADSDAAKAAFAALGVNIKNADGTLRGTEAVFTDIAEAMSKLPDGATKNAVGIGIFGRAFAQLVPLLNGGSAGLAAARKELERFGGVISGETAQAAEEFNDNLTRLKTASSSLGISLAKDVVPALAEMTTEFAKNYREANGLLKTFAAIGSTISRMGGGKDQQRLGELLADEIGLQKDISELQKSFDQGDVGKLPFAIKLSDLKAELASVRAEAAGLKVVLPPSLQGAGRSSNEQFGPNITDDQKRINEARARAVLDGAAGDKKRVSDREALLKVQAEYVLGLDKEIAALKQGNELEKYRVDLLSGVAKDFDPKVKQHIEDLLKELEILEGTAEVQKVLNGYVKERSELESKLSSDQAAHRQALLDSLQTPLEKYTATVKDLVANDLGNEKLQEGIKRARVEMENAQTATAGLKDIAGDLGLTFTSAFEDAVVGAGKFSDVLKGLADDITKLLIRKSVTEPLFNLLAGTKDAGGVQIPGLIEKGGTALGTWFGNLFGNDKGGLYRVGGGSGEHPVAFTARAGELVAVGTGMSGGGNAPNVYIYEATPGTTAGAAPNGRDIEVFVGGGQEHGCRPRRPPPAAGVTLMFKRRRKAAHPANVLADASLAYFRAVLPEIDRSLWQASCNALDDGGRIMTAISATNEGGVEILVSVFAKPGDLPARVHYARTRNGEVLESGAPPAIAALHPIV